MIAPVLILYAWKYKVLQQLDSRILYMPSNILISPDLFVHFILLLNTSWVFILLFYDVW